VLNKQWRDGVQLGVVGLGRMGSNIARRLLRQGHRVVGYDRNPEAIAALIEAGGRGAGTIAELHSQLHAPAAIWVMLPAGEPTETTIDALARICRPGDVLIDSGNGHF
jgi:6-phosphogluconate dehydrogenase